MNSVPVQLAKTVAVGAISIAAVLGIEPVTKPPAAEAVDCVVETSAPVRSGRTVSVVHVVRCSRPLDTGAAELLRNGKVVASRRWSPPLDGGLYSLNQRVRLRCGALYRGRYFADGWRYGPARRFCRQAVAG